MEINNPYVDRYLDINLEKRDYCLMVLCDVARVYNQNPESFELSMILAAVKARALSENITNSILNLLFEGEEDEDCD